MKEFDLNEDKQEENLLDEHRNCGNYYHKQKQTLMESYEVLKTMNDKFKFDCRFQRRNNLRQYQERLPIYSKKLEFINSFAKHQVIIFKSNAGSGKSTQLPQYLLDCGSGRILVTEPRVIAAESVARRVAEVLWECKANRKSNRSEETLARMLWDMSQVRTTILIVRTVK